MKKSLFNLVSFVFLAFLSVFVPAYILATGSATLLPVAQFGAALAGLAGLGLAGFGAAMVYRAERHADITAHVSLIKTHALLSGIPAWRKVAALVRHAIQFVLLMAVGSPVFATYAFAGLVGFLIHRGMLDAYIGRLQKGGIIKESTVRLSKSENGREYFSGIGLKVGSQEQPFVVQGGQVYVPQASVRSGAIQQGKITRETGVGEG